MDVASILASTSDGGAWYLALAAEPLLLLQELHPGLNVSSLPPPSNPISLRSERWLQKRACSNGSTGNSNGNNNSNNNNNNNSNNSSSNSNSGSSSKSSSTSIVGPVVGAVVGTLVLAVAAFLIYRAVQRRKAARAAATANSNPSGNAPPFPVSPGTPGQTYTPPPMKETGSYMGAGGMPNAYQVNMNVTNAASAPSTYSGSDRMSYYNPNPQTPGNAYFNQMPPQMPTPISQNPPYNSSAPSPWNVNMAGPPVHPGQSPSPGVVSYYSATPAPSTLSAPAFTADSSRISSTSSPPPMSPSVAGSSNYAPWANPDAQISSGSNPHAPVPMDAFMTAHEEKAHFSGIHPMSEKVQFSGAHGPMEASMYASGSKGGAAAGEASKPSSDTAKESAPAPAPAPGQERNNAAAAEEEDAIPVGLPPPAYTYTA